MAEKWVALNKVDIKYQRRVFVRNLLIKAFMLTAALWLIGFYVGTKFHR